MDFAYYLLAAGTHPRTKADSSSPGWCLEFTSHEEMAVYVRQKANFPINFAAHTQGESVGKVVAEVIGNGMSTSKRGAKKEKPKAQKPKTKADIAKGELSAGLRELLSENSSIHPFLIFTFSVQLYGQVTYDTNF